MRPASLLSLLLALLVAACTKIEPIPARTQVMLRISNSDGELLAQMDGLRVAVRLNEGARWRDPVSKNFAAAGLSWPVEIPVTPRVPTEASSEFEVVVDALRAGEVIAQTRVVTSFAEDEQRVEELELYLCRNDQGIAVCAEPDCVGADCQVCSKSGGCGVTPRVEEDAGEPPLVTEMDAGQGLDASDAMSVSDSATLPDAAEAGPLVVPEYALGVAGAACAASLEQSLGCEGHASRKILKCQQGAWQVLQTCSASERCESRVGTDQGTCSVIPAACAGKQPGDICDGTARLECGIDLVNVTSKTCPEHMHCDASAGTKCVCDTGYEPDGQDGCRNPDNCPANACTGGRCVDGLSDWSCDCNEGYTGTGTKSCTAVLYCPKDACAPGGTCNDTMNWSCQCGSGFSGTATRACTNTNDCPSDRCRAPNGVCADLVNGYRCDCNPGFSGTDCVNDICGPNPCRNGGTCSRTGTLCTCQPGFSGTNCQTDVCNPSPCLNGGTCSRTGTRCACSAGYAGTNCEIRTCTPNPCLNGGSCSQGAQGASCTCPLGYQGTTCASEVTSCVANNLCTGSDYPCTQTSTSGYTCLGHYADWRMPVNVAGATPAPSYTSTSDVVNDNITGLVWQRVLPATYDGCTGRISTTGDSCSFNEARSYCDRLTLGGQSDWRLPSKIELSSILDESRSAPPTIDPGSFPNTPETGFWTSSRYPSPIGASYVVAFWDGTSRAIGDTSGLHVRCVRGVPPVPTTPARRYVVDTTANTVRDTRTNLTWQRNLPSTYPTCANGSACTLAEARSYCASLGGSYRLPHMKELMTLVNPTRLQPSIDVAAFPSTPGEPFWSATPALTPAGSSYYVTFENGNSGAHPNTMAYPRVRCVF